MTKLENPALRDRENYQQIVPHIYTDFIPSNYHHVSNITNFISVLKSDFILYPIIYIQQFIKRQLI